MIHLSTPTDFSSPQALPADVHPRNGDLAGNLSADSPFPGREGRGGGIFAKLLEALFAKGKTGPNPEAVLIPDELETAAEHTDVNYAWQFFDRLDEVGVPRERLDAHVPGEALPAQMELFGGEGVLALSGQEPLTGQNPRGTAQGHSGDPHYADQLYSERPVFPRDDTPEYLSNTPRELRDIELSAKAGEKTDLAFAKEANSDRASTVNAAGAAGERFAPSELGERRGRAAIEVRDLRTGEAREVANINATTVEGSRSVGYDALRSPLQEVELPVNLKLAGQSGDGLIGKKTGFEFSPSSFFEDALARELRGNLSGDIVKNASLIIRNGGEGTIRLALNPASLGHVKIHLEMTENKIMGHIIVESNEALRAFQKELPVLERAFRDSGFLETSLDMSLAQDSRDFTPGQERQEENFLALDPGMAASRYEAGVELVEDTFISDNAVLAGLPERKSINLFV